MEGNKALGLGRLVDNGFLESIRGWGGRSGLLAAARVVGKVAKVRTVTISGDEVLVRVTELLVDGGLTAKSSKQETVSISSS